MVLQMAPEHWDAKSQEQDVRAQDVVILGSGAFACEVMEEAVANNARSVKLVARERRRCCSPLLL